MNTRCKKIVLAFAGFLLGISLLWSRPVKTGAAEEIESEWGGQVKAQGFVSWPGGESIFMPVGTETSFDGNVQFRLKNILFLSNWGYFETHYESVLSGGDIQRKGKSLERLFPNLFRDGFLLGRPVEDDRRLLDLTKTIDESDSHIFYHRLDRLYLGLNPNWGSFRIGRQATTWGNGLLFNPMDLFNPFAPTDIERDYKIGDDMMKALFPVSGIGDFQVLYVVRRDPVSNDVLWSQSSLAGKLHFAKGTTEFDIMASKHFKDSVIGMGSTGYMWDAAWRMDATWTFLDENRGNNDYLSLVANMDYSWVLWEKNFYGFLEFYFNGLGVTHYSETPSDPDIAERLDRGEIFVLGSTYLSGHLRVEVHPLLNVLITLINNLNDPSGIVQPRAIWDIAENVQIAFGGNILYGRRGTEFGGFEIPGTNFLSTTPDSAFLWLTYYF